jgi:hypothetical protein
MLDSHSFSVAELLRRMKCLILVRCHCEWSEAISMIRRLEIATATYCGLAMTIVKIPSFEKQVFGNEEPLVIKYRDFYLTRIGKGFTLFLWEYRK